MSQNFNRTPLMVAAALAAATSGLGLSAEVVERPSGLGGWLERNNRHRYPKGKKAKPVRRARLQRATGPGSMNQENEFWELVRDGRAREAAEYYQRCLNINYRAGKPTVSKRMAFWMAVYKAQRAA